MADIRVAFEKMLKLEFNSPANALHFNEGENGYTFMGIYEFAHPTWSGWDKVKAVLKAEASVAKASVKLYYDESLALDVVKFYKVAFWDRMKLDEVVSQKIAEELLVFAVNAGIGVAVKVAQKVIGVQADGVLGSRTIKALNEYDDKKFDIAFDKAEIEHYQKLVNNNPNFKKFINGWKNRAVAV